ncbi:PspC domain-containing protein [Bacillus thuringiensis]|nr:PspC domain-containing protein [Bacillus thuringiensis]
MLFGICGGLGEYFDISSTLIRIIWDYCCFMFWDRIFSLFHLFITYATFVLMVSFHILKKSKSPIEFYR